MNGLGRRAFVRNLSFAFAAQAISLLLSALTTLLLPRFLGVEAYGYWQLFLFYASYVGFFHFGLNDGVYLKFGGTPYRDMDKRSIGAQFRFGMAFQSIIALGAALVCLKLTPDGARRFVWIATAVYMLLFNATLYLGYVFQAANETRLYSISVIIDKCFFMAAIAALLLSGARDFQTYVVLYLAAKAVSLGYCLVRGREIVFAPRMRAADAAAESLASIRIGANLMLANIASMLILGIGRFFIDRAWGIEAFARFSLSLQLTSFFLQFISQVSIVLFPALRRLETDRQKEFFGLAGDALGLILPAVLLLYAPARVVLGLWLPRYQESLAGMALLLPICLFDGKMQMLYSTFFKVLRRERALLAVNLASMLLSALLAVIGVHILKNLHFVILSMVASVAFRSLVSEVYLSRLMRRKVGLNAAAEVGLAAGFMLLSWYLPPWHAFFAYGALYAVFLWCGRGRARRVAAALRAAPGPG